MSDDPKLHRGHLALLGYIKDGEPRAAYSRNGTVQIDGISQDFLTGWYDQLKAWSFISAEDLLGRTGHKLGETIQITEAGAAKLRQAEAVA